MHLLDRGRQCMCLPMSCSGRMKNEGCETGGLAPCSHLISVKSKHCNNHSCTVNLIQTTAISHKVSKAFWTATSVITSPGRLLHSRCLKKGTICCTYNSIVPLRVVVVVEVLKCNFSITFSLGQGTFRAQRTKDFRCCPAEPYRRPLLFTHIMTDSKFLLNWDNNP